MNRSRLAFFARLSISLALLVAMTGTAYAHRFDPPLAPALQAFLQAGGTLDDLCSDAHDGHDQANQTCDACRLVGTAMLPLVAHTNTFPLRIPARLVPFTAPDVLSFAIADPSRNARAPPVA